MKKRKKNQLKLWAIGILAILLFAAPCGALEVPSGTTLDVGAGYPDTQIDEFLLVSGTLNLHQGAYVNDSIFALGGGTVNIYGGQLGSDDYFIAVCSGENGNPDPVVTVYGTDFAVEGNLLDDSVTQYIGSGDWTLTVTYVNGGDQIDLLFSSYGGVPVYLERIENETDEVEIDIKPGGNPNNINLKSKGVVPVALLTAGDFEAGDVDPGSVEFEGALPVRAKLCDVDEDGDMDMLFHFRTQELIKSVDNPEGLDETSTEATLTATTIDGVQIEATDQVRIVPCKKKNYHSSDGKYKFSNRHTPKYKRPVRNHKDR